MMTLARAMQVKNQLVKRLAETRNLIYGANSHPATETVDVDVRELYDLQQQMLDKLIELKTAMAEANHGIRHEIFEIGELNATIDFLLKVPHKAGRQARWGGLTPCEEEYVAEIGGHEIREKVRQLRQRLDQLQQQVDAYNAQTKIEVDVPSIMLH